MKSWKAILGLVLVFGLGMLAGGLVTGAVVARRLHRAAQQGSLFTPGEITRFMGRRLRLDAGQRAQVEVIDARTQAEIRAVRQQAHPQVEAALDQAVADIRPLLRPAQQERFDRLVAIGRRRWHQAADQPR